MALSDRKLHYDALTRNSAPAEVRVTGEVSGSWRPGDRGADGVVFQAGRPVLDRDLNVAQDVAELRSALLRRWQAPSGWLRASCRTDPAAQYGLGRAPAGLVDNTGKAVTPDGRLRNAVVLPRLEAVVAGYPVVVEFTNTPTAGRNLLLLQPPTIYDGTARTVKRSDFLFLEVWRALIGPAGIAYAEVIVLSAANLSEGDFVQVGATKLTASATPGPATFPLGLSDAATALAIEGAVNDPAGPFAGLVTARAQGSRVRLAAVGFRGAAGNSLTLSTSTAKPGALGTSGPRFSGGFDQPARPTPSAVYRHGNVSSPAATWLPDDILDPEVGTDTCMRVQVQYRIRSTGSGEAVSFRDHPDGFSSRSSGGADPALFAQGGRSKPVWSGNGVDARSYPFVPADNRSGWLDSSASAYGLVDDGLWVAGDGTAQAAADLGALDGFVFALPLAFVFRRNDCSDPGAAILGWDPVNNTNGAPTLGHATYAGTLGPVPAGASDRPDGRFADCVEPGDLLDLRRHATLAPLSLTAELQYQELLLLTAELRTWAGDASARERIGSGSGSAGTEHLLCDEVGRTKAAGGVAPASGDTGRGRAARNFDHLARKVSDRPRVERACFALWPGDRPTAAAQGGPAAPGTVKPAFYVVKVEKSPGVPADPAAWTEGDVLVLDLGTMDASSLGSLFSGGDGGGSSAAPLDTSFAALAPPGTIISDFLGAWHDDGSSAAAVDATAQPRWVRGLGTLRVEVALDANNLRVDGGDPGGTARSLVGGGGPLPGSPRRIFVELEVSYPAGQGLLASPESLLAPDPAVYAGGKAPGPGPLVEADATQRPADMESLAPPQFQKGLREVRLEYVANATISHAAGAGMPGVPASDQVVSRTPREVVLPRRVFGLPGLVQVTDLVAKAPVAVDEDHSDFGSSTRTLRLLSNLSGAGQTLCQVDYFAQDPLPNYGAKGYQVGAYYRAAAPQTAGADTPMVGAGGPVPGALPLEVLAAQHVWAVQAGQGSAELGLFRPDHVPVRDGRILGDLTREGFFTATLEVSLSDTSLLAGSLRLEAVVPLRLSGSLVAGGAAAGALPRPDAEGRIYYPASGGVPLLAAARSLSGAARHRSVATALCRVAADVPSSSGALLFRRSELVLVVVSQLSTLDEVVAADLRAGNLACVAAYKTRGLLMLPGDEVASDL